MLPRLCREHYEPLSSRVTQLERFEDQIGLRAARRGDSCSRVVTTFVEVEGDAKAPWQRQAETIDQGPLGVVGLCHAAQVDLGTLLSRQDYVDGLDAIEFLQQSARILEHQREHREQLT